MLLPYTAAIWGKIAETGRNVKTICKLTEKHIPNFLIIISTIMDITILWDHLIMVICILTKTFNLTKNIIWGWIIFIWVNWSLVDPVHWVDGSLSGRDHNSLGRHSPGWIMFYQPTQETDVLHNGIIHRQFYWKQSIESQAEPIYRTHMF